MKEYLFSYGTLQNEKVQMDLFGKILPGSIDVLSGYKVATIEIFDREFLSKSEETCQKTLISSEDKNDMVNGIALEVTSHELSIADKYEPANYKRISVALESRKKAWIYFADDNNLKNLNPGSSDHDR